MPWPPRSFAARITRGAVPAVLAALTALPAFSAAPAEPPAILTLPADPAAPKSANVQAEIAESNEQQANDSSTKKRADKSDEVKNEVAKKDDANAKTWVEGPFRLSYDHGVLLESTSDKAIFSLRAQYMMQIRHSALDRYSGRWTDRTGVDRPILPRNDFEIERNRLTFTGRLIHPKLSYRLSIDADTDSQFNVVRLFDTSLDYEFAPWLVAHVGKGRLPVSRQWMTPFAQLMLPDRAMSTGFFRPDRTIGAWATGELPGHWHYHAMLGNAYDSLSLRQDDIDDQFAYAAMMWWEPIGAYGESQSDLRKPGEDGLVIRLGHSLGSAGVHSTSALPNQELQLIRLSDGTPLTQTGALGRGVTVDKYDLTVHTVDAAVKYRGLNVTFEYFFRWIQGIGAGESFVPITRIYDHGYYVEAGYFVIPQRLEIAGRHAKILGSIKDSGDHGVAVNWYVRGANNWKVSTELMYIDRSPVQVAGGNLRVGEHGLRWLTQLQIGF